MMRRSGDTDTDRFDDNDGGRRDGGDGVAGEDGDGQGAWENAPEVFPKFHL